MKKKLSIVSACFNEEANVQPLYDRVKKTLAAFPDLDFEMIFADNRSTDRTREKLLELAARDRRVKLIFNTRNFGHIRSPFNAMLAADGDAVVLICADLQEPPELIAEFITKWKSGYKVVAGVRRFSKSGRLMEPLRKLYYRLLNASSADCELISQFTGFGLYDRAFMDAVGKFNEPYPYFRGLVGEIGFDVAQVAYTQEKRLSGKTKNNLFTLYDMAVTGFVNHSRLPLRLAVIAGFATGFFSLMAAAVYLVLKILMWNTFQLGLAPLIIGMFFLASVQLVAIGILGEYVGAIWLQTKNRPLVIEERRVNFDSTDGKNPFDEDKDTTSNGGEGAYSGQ